MCGGHEECRILEKSVEQVDYVLSSNKENIFLKSCPGSGKTETVGLKAAYSIQNWQGLPGGIAVLTFTNNAATEIRQRVSQFNGIEKTEYPHYIGTIDSWLHGYIANPFAHLITGYKGQNSDCSIRLVDSSSEADFLNSFRTKYGLNRTGKPSANQYYLEHESQEKKYVFSSGNESIDRLRKSSTLETWRESDLLNTKKRFWQSGFAIFQDIENISFDLLANMTDICMLVARRFPFIIVDECQDLSWIQLKVLDKLRERGTVLHFVGDLNQGIYEFRKVDPQAVQSFTRDRSFKVLPLSSNYRSCQPIVNLCNRIVGNDDPEKSECSQLIDKPCICVTYSEDEMHLLPMWFANYLPEECCEKSRSEIVARSWKNVSLLRPARNRDVKGPPKTLAAAIYLWKSRYSQSIEDSLRYMGRFITDKYFFSFSCDPRYHYCPECVDSHLRWRLFLSYILEVCCAVGSPLSDLNQTWSKWAEIVRFDFGKHIRDGLQLIGDNLKVETPPIDDLDHNMFRAPLGEGNQVVLDTLPAFPKDKETNLRITTIHSVKGKTLDGLMLVSARSKQGTIDGYWTQWIENPKSEAARLAYVASSRPKHLLVWAIPSTSNKNELKKISGLGFEIISVRTTNCNV